MRVGSWDGDRRSTKEFVFLGGEMGWHKHFGGAQFGGLENFLREWSSTIM